MIDLIALSAELRDDPNALKYGDKAADARRQFPEDEGVQDVIVADALNDVSLPAVSGVTTAEVIIEAFAAEEWANAMFLFNILFGIKVIKLGPNTIFEKGLAFLVSNNTLTAKRAQEIHDTVMGTLPKMSRAQQLGLELITPSEVADARRVIGSLEVIAVLGITAEGVK